MLDVVGIVLTFPERQRLRHPIPDLTAVEHEMTAPATWRHFTRLIVHLRRCSSRFQAPVPSM